MSKSYTIIRTNRNFPKDCKQNFVTELISKTIKQNPIKLPFSTFINKANLELHGQHYNLFIRFLKILKGDLDLHLSKQKRRLNCDAYFPKPWNFIFEFDEFQHFSSSKKIILKHYPKGNYGFDINRFIYLCEKFSDEADEYYKNKTTKEFDSPKGRTRLRVLLDAFRDILPNNENININPTIRFDEFEVGEILDDFTDNNDESMRKIKTILNEHFEMAGMTKQIQIMNKL